MPEGTTRYRITLEFDAATEWPNIPQQLFEDVKTILDATNGLSIKNLEGSLTKVNEGRS